MATEEKKPNESEYYLIKKDEMENFMERCMLAAGAKTDHAKSLANCLIAGDHRGHFSHGLNRLGRLRALNQCFKAL
jgi:LDH2 family malate/lactate/ureidoglycolate dehydrogenase